jgi:hypothetical protein
MSDSKASLTRHHLRRYHQNVWWLHANKVPDLQLLDVDISVYLFWNTPRLWNVVDTRISDKRSHTCISKHWSGGTVCLLFIWQVLCSNFGLNTGHNRVVLWFSSITLCKCWESSQMRPHTLYSTSILLH